MQGTEQNKQIQTYNPSATPAEIIPAAQDCLFFYLTSQLL